MLVLTSSMQILSTPSALHSDLYQYSSSEGMSCINHIMAELMYFMLQWGSLGFHKKSLANLAEAMKRTRKLCAVMVDSVGRELIINRPTQDDDDGWPTFEAGIAVEANQKACLSFHSIPACIRNLPPGALTASSLQEEEDGGWPACGTSRTVRQISEPH